MDLLRSLSQLILLAIIPPKGTTRPYRPAQGFDPLRLAASRDNYLDPPLAEAQPTKEVEEEGNGNYVTRPYSLAGSALTKGRRYGRPSRLGLRPSQLLMRLILRQEGQSPSVYYRRPYPPPGHAIPPSLSFLPILSSEASTTQPDVRHEHPAFSLSRIRPTTAKGFRLR